MVKFIINTDIGEFENIGDAIQYFLDNPLKIEEMGRYAMNFAEQEFNPQKYYERLMEIYEMAMVRKNDVDL